MASNNELRETDIKNRAYHYFDDITNINELDSKNVRVDQKSYKKIFFFTTLNMKYQMV